MSDNGAQIYELMAQTVSEQKTWVLYLFFTHSSIVYVLLECSYVSAIRSSTLFSVCVASKKELTMGDVFSLPVLF